jgi:hypothetical protein
MREYGINLNMELKMSSQYKKIKYETEGPYGSTEEMYLYIHSHDTCDVVNVFDHFGDYLFSCSETGFDLGQAMAVAFTDWENKRMEKVNRLERDTKFNR